MAIDLQPLLENEYIRLQPLQTIDFEALYAVASDPLIWEQHPNKQRYQRDVFQTFFEGAILSKGAFLIVDRKTNEIIGCSRFYDYNEKESSVFIGYTFIARKFWGKQYNFAVKKLMLDHAFQSVSTVLFHIGSGNIRSQIAIGRIGAIKSRELIVAYHGEDDKLNFEYVMRKTDWIKHQHLI